MSAHDESDLYFFGCIDRDEGGHRTMCNGHSARCLVPSSPWGGTIDQGLTPKSPETQGAALLHHKDGWTALAIHDYTGDSRPGSNSVFLCVGTLSADEMLVRARRWYPRIVQRIGTIAAGIHDTETPK